MGVGVGVGACDWLVLARSRILREKNNALSSLVVGFQHKFNRQGDSTTEVARIKLASRLTRAELRAATTLAHKKQTPCRPPGPRASMRSSRDGPPNPPGYLSVQQVGDPCIMVMQYSSRQPVQGHASVSIIGKA